MRSYSLFSVVIGGVLRSFYLKLAQGTFIFCWFCLLWTKDGNGETKEPVRLFNLSVALCHKKVSLVCLLRLYGSIIIKPRLFHYHLNVPSGTVCLNTSTNAGIWNTTLQVKGSWFQNPVVDFCSVLLSVMFAEVHWKERDVFLS